MVIAGLGKQQFIDLLKANGYDVLSFTYWELEGVERIVLGKDGHTFAFRLKGNGRYLHNEVTKRCQMLDIGLDNCPEDIKDDLEACFKASQQYLDYLQMRDQQREDEMKATVATDKVNKEK